VIIGLGGADLTAQKRAFEKSDNGAPIGTRRKNAVDEKSRSLTPDGVHGERVPRADFAIIVGRAECNLRGDAQHSGPLSRCTYRRCGAMPIALALRSCRRAPRDRTPYLHSDGRLSSRACITTDRDCRSDAFV